MSTLKQIHSNIKDHPYRLDFDKKYVDDYKKELLKLSTEFYLSVKDTRYSDASSMFHDFNCSIRNLSRPHIDIYKDHLLHTERCLGVIHEYIDTGIVSVYYTYYTGANHLGLPKVGTFIFDSKLNKYFREMTNEDADNAIAHLMERKSKSKSSSIIDDYFNKRIEYIENTIKYWNSRRY